jgi:hypothetical protein
MNFYPRLQVRVQISTRSLFADGQIIVLPDPNPRPVAIPKYKLGLNGYKTGDESKDAYCRVFMQ